MKRSIALALRRTTLLLIALVSPAAAGQPQRIDAKTGRDLLNYPPPLHFDHLHIRLEIDIPSMSVPRLTARQVLTSAAVARDRSVMRLDAVGMTIRTVEVPGRKSRYEHTDGVLSITLDPPARRGEVISTVIEYELDYPIGTGAGLTWTPGREGASNLTAASPQIHTQGQPDSNRMWFPCHDFPNDRVSSEMVITTEAGYDVCANGKLVLRARLADGREQWHWFQKQTHPTYLIAMVIGKFDVVSIGGPGSARPGIPMAVYAPVGKGERVAEAFGRTPDMVASFERLFDEPFPWDKYHQLLVRAFAAGAMENTTVVTFQEFFADMGRDGVEDIVAHELVHHWFGDLVGYKSWEHLWLGEGWASFGEALWAELSAEPGKERRAYERKIAGFLSSQRATNRTRAPDHPAMMSKLYGDADSNFMKANDVYSKGAVVLHMLRMRLGDEVFFRATRLYLDRFKFQQVETDDFRRCLEDASGESLDRFFDQWVRRPGLPRLGADVRWDAQASALVVRVEQTQHIDADNPAYAMVIPIFVKSSQTDGQYFHLPMDTKATKARFPLEGPPVDVIIDPNMTNAAPTRVEKSLAMWLHQIRDESPFAQAQAAAHLAEFDDPRAAAAVDEHYRTTDRGDARPLGDAVPTAFQVTAH